jgi:subtilisin family serine protease
LQDAQTLPIVHAICSNNITQYDLEARRLGLPADCHMPVQCKHVYSGACLSGLAGTFSSSELVLLLNTCLPLGSVLYHEKDAPVIKAEHQYKKPNFDRKSNRRSLRQAPSGAEFEENSAINGDQLNFWPISQGQDISLLEEKQQTLSVPLWNLDRIDQQYLPLDKTYSFGSAESPGIGQGVTIYVLDTGIMTNHQEFQTWDSIAEITSNNQTKAASLAATSNNTAITNSASTSRASCGHDFVENSTNCEDIDGHGSHVAGTAIGLQVGVAKGASVVAVKILDAQGLGTVGSTIAGLDYVASIHTSPAVVTLSLGVQRGQYSRAMEDAVRALVEDHGVMVIAAAGNAAGDSCQFSPGATPQAFTVAASDFAGTYTDFSNNTTSNNGSTTNNESKSNIVHEEKEGVYIEGNQGTCVDLFAPGVDIYSVCGGIRRCGHVSTSTYAYASGTSMAVPHVAGAAAIYFESHPQASPAEVAEALKGAAIEGVIAPMVLKEGTVNKLLQVKGLDGNQTHAVAAVQAADGPATAG